MFPSDEEISHARWLEARGILDTDKIERFTAKVRDVISDYNIEGQRILMCATSLAHHGLLSSMWRMTLLDVDLSPVPTQHLASLASCVTSTLDICKVHNCDLVSLFTSLKCTKLFITRQSLGREETQALVQAMEYRVEKVMLDRWVTLDIEALAEYSGQGRCKYLRFSDQKFEDTKEKYRQELKTWARSKDWTIDDQGGKLKLNAVDLIDLTIE